MIWEGLGRHWYGDVIFCKMFKFLQTFSLTSSNYMLVAMAMDRHRAITRPLTMPGSPYKLLSSAWLFSLLPSVPCLFIFKVEFRDSLLDSILQPECVSDFTYWPTFLRKLYFSGVAIIIFAIPLVLFIGLYSHIVYELWVTVSRLNHIVGLLHRTFLPINAYFLGWASEKLAAAEPAVPSTDQDNQLIHGGGSDLLVDQPSLHCG